MPSSFGRHILLLVPHPDDEIVACFAALRRAQAEGAKIYALYLTHGCISQETRWPWDRKRHDWHVARRRAEAEQAARQLELIPVGWSHRPARSLWQQMNSVKNEIVSALKQHVIDQIWVPAYEGGNPDHDAVNAITSTLTGKVSVLEFAEYNFAGGRARSQEFPAPNGSEKIISLGKTEQEQKQQALKLYKSEQCNLGYVQTERECFRPLAHYDYRQPPHAGTLWYARFRWVPFRHPRVDFSDPADVGRAITEFLTASPAA
jgi:LmbE family N-acetylglucosaminyl deacetylase